MKRKHFSDSELKSLHNAVQAAEQKTGVEIVPVVVARSASYLGFHLLFALIGLAAATGIILLLSRALPWWGGEELAVWQAVGFAFGFLLSEPPFVLRYCLQESALRREVRKAAAAQLVLLSRSHTHGARGKVLIFISLLERRVQVLAEESVRAKVESDFWRAQAEAVARGVAQGRRAQAVEEAIYACAEALSGK